MLRLALRVPVATGENGTLIVHIVSAAKLAPHVFVWPKSPLLTPVTVMLEMLIGAPPVFDIVTVWALLFVPTV